MLRTAALILIPATLAATPDFGLGEFRPHIISRRGQSREINQHVELGDFTSGLGKSIFFGYLIGIIACFEGLTASGGADGVGRATTSAVVAASISVLISDFFLTKLFLAI